MRVLVDGRCLDRPLSGTQRHVLELARALAATPSVSPALLLPRVPHETAVAHVAALETSLDTYTTERAPRKPADVFHRPYQFATVPEVRASRRLGRRLVLTQQDMILDRTPEYHPSQEEWAAFRRTTSAAFEAADQVTFFSRHAATDAARDGGIAPERVTIVPLGVDHRSGPDDTGAVPDVGDLPFLLTIGGALRHKNRLLALQLLDHVRGSFGWEGQLVLAGDRPTFGSSVGDEERFLEARPALRPLVRDLGHVSEGERTWLYRSAALVLFPSLDEGFGLVPFEAAAHGTPCVYGWHGSLPEYLPEEGAALDGRDTARSARAVNDVLADAGRASALVRAINSAGSRLTWARAAEAYAEVYRRAWTMPGRDRGVVLRRLRGIVR